MSFRSVVAFLVLSGCSSVVTADVLTYTAPATRRENHLRLRRNGSHLELSNERDGSVVARLAASDATGVVVRGANGNVDDTLTVDFAGGAFALRDGIRYDGGRDGYDALVIENGSFARSGHVIHNVHSGVLSYDDLAVVYSNLEPITDTSGSATFTINATDAANTITIDNGTTTGDGIVRVTVDANESISFANKNDVTINGGLTAADGNDTFIVNFSDFPFALNSLTLNGDDPGATAAGADTFAIQDTPAVFRPIHINAGQGNDQVVFSDGVSLGDGAVDGGAGTDVLDYTSVFAPVYANLGSNAPNLSATLGSDQEVPPTTSSATGTATMTYDNVNHILNINIAVSGIAPADVIGFHIHTGAVGTNGPVLINLPPAAPLVPDGSGGFTYSDLTGFPATAEAALLGGATYINVHTPAAPGGLIRGQIFADAPLVAATGTASFTGTATNFENVIGGGAADGLIGGPGVNDLRGMLGGDTIAGGGGSDTLNGDAGSDLLLWTAGDGSDALNGGVDTDALQISGSAGADGFTLSNGPFGQITFSGTAPFPFGLQIGTTETVILAGRQGDDAMLVNDLALVLDLGTLVLHGLGGNDTFQFTAASSGGRTYEVNGAGGADRINGPDAPTTTWNITGVDVGNITGLVSNFRFIETLSGGGGIDTFNMRGSPNAPYTVIGGSPVVAPGDTLNYDSQFAGVFGDTTPPDGTFNSTGMQPITFSQIEGVTLINADADLTITKSDTPDPAIAGTNITYTIVVTNPGPAEATLLSLSDAIPANTTFVSFTAPAGWTTSTPAIGGSGTVTATTPSMPSGGSATFTLVVRVAAATPAGSIITNTATISTSSTDPAPGNNSIGQTTAVAVSNDISVTKSGSAGAAPSPGSATAFTIAVSNLGPSDAQNVIMTDAIPANTTFAALSQSGPAFTCTTPPVGATGTVTCTAATLPAGSTTTFTLTVTISPAATPGSTISNTATVTSATTDPNAANNTSTGSVTVGVPAIPTLAPVLLVLLTAMLGAIALTRMR